ncbi:DedA family protein [Microvirga guangxiensis]|uniref:Membrane protein DedA, SNARE-associated domain n=1 Tax=Microvirga guangxiensis TaxID=549386 RepID=A0A1G5H4P9_9HYPH|nr:DedA family protein [Microvirga guangxiensis]SCY58631.1 membrane protein DedA, SNARE-associated domain [Microvirga guangxiensis]
MALLQHVFGSVEAAIAAYGVLALFLILYFESFGVPLPGESALITVSLLAAHGDHAIGHVILAAWCGAVLGDSTGYLIGRIGGRPVLLWLAPKIRLTPDRLARIEKTARDKGFIMVMTARFVVGLRQLNGILAGSVAMPWPRFVLANALGALLWASFWSLGAYFFADLFRRFL